MANLTKTEIEHLLLIAEGKGEAEAAIELGVAIGTVKYFRKQIRTKFGTHTMSHAIAKAYHDGILTVPHSIIPETFTIKVRGKEIVYIRLRDTQ